MSKTALLIKLSSAVPILLGLAAFAAAFREDADATRLVALGAGVWSLVGALVLFGFAHLIEAVDRIAASTRKLAALSAESRAEEREREPPPQAPEDGPYTIAQFDHRGYLVHRLNDGTLAVETRDGWMRFRSLAELDARL